MINPLQSLCGSMFVLHSTVFADRQAFAGSLKVFLAGVFFLAGFQAFGGGFMGCSHGPVTLDVLLQVLRFLVLGPSSVDGHQAQGDKDPGPGQRGTGQTEGHGANSFQQDVISATTQAG
jgi:hypothetical protein